MIGSALKNSIKGWYFTSNEIKETLAVGKILNPSIDLTNACNLNCPYCYIEEKNSIRKHRKANELSFEETLKVINDLADCGARTINIVGAGEPTVDEHFEEIKKIAEQDSKHTELLKIERIRVANNFVLKFLYDTADAHGLNMINHATFNACKYIDRKSTRLNSSH